MRIVDRYSHLNGFEYIIVRKPQVWQEIVDVIGQIDAQAYRTQGSSLAFSSGDLNQRFQEEFDLRGWHEYRTSLSQMELMKDRVALEVQFGKYSFNAYDLIAKHLAFYVGDVIDVGVEVLPMKEMSAQMSSGISYYEGELYNVIRQGRGVPAVPLVLIGVAP